MKRYRLSAQVTISVSTVVDAESPEAAIEEAENRSMVSLCHQCAGGEEEVEWITSGELDGEPQRVEATEEEAD
jgi:hypothetical protein